MSNSYNQKYGQRGYDERWDRTSESLIPTINMQTCQSSCMSRCYFSYEYGDYFCEAKLAVWLPIILIAIIIVIGALGMCAWRAMRGRGSERDVHTQPVQFRKDPERAFNPAWTTRA